MTTTYRPFIKQTPIIDSHSHMGFYKNFNIPMNDPEGMLAQMDATGIDIACVSHHAGISADYAYGNDEILSAVRKYPARFVGFCVVNPNYPLDISAEIRRCFSTNAFRGFKVHPELHGDYPLDGPGYREMWEYADEHGLPVLSHSYFGGDGLPVFEALARKYVGVTILLGHAGLDLGLDNAAALTQRVPNIVLDITAMQRHCWAVEYLAARTAPTRLVWGSDTPFIDPALMLGAVALADIPVDFRDAILYHNMARILNIETNPLATSSPSVEGTL